MERVFADVYSVAALILAHNRLVETILIQITCTTVLDIGVKKDAVIAILGHVVQIAGDQRLAGFGITELDRSRSQTLAPAIYGDPFWMFNAKTVFPDIWIQSGTTCLGRCAEPRILGIGSAALGASRVRGGDWQRSRGRRGLARGNGSARAAADSRKR